MITIRAKLLSLFLGLTVVSSLCLASSETTMKEATSSVEKIEKSKVEDICSKENLKIDLIVDKTTLTCDKHPEKSTGYSKCSSNFFLEISSPCKRIKSLMVVCKTNFLHAYEDKPQDFIPDRARKVENFSEMNSTDESYFKMGIVEVSSADYYVKDNPIVKVRPTWRECDVVDIQMLHQP